MEKVMVKAVRPRINVPQCCLFTQLDWYRSGLVVMDLTYQHNLGLIESCVK